MANNLELLCIKNTLDCLKLQRDVLDNDHMNRQSRLLDQIRSAATEQRRMELVYEMDRLKMDLRCQFHQYYTRIFV